MRLVLAIALVATLGLAAAATQERLPLKQDLEVLTEGPMRADKVKDGLYVIRGPFLLCMRGCPPGQVGDGLYHESGDVALRVTPAGLIVVDDKFPDQAAEVLAQVRKVSALPVRYVLNSHHHADHVSGNAHLRNALVGVDVVGHRNIRENFLRLKQPGEPTLTFDDRAAIHLGGVEVQLLWLGRGHTNGDTIIYFPDLKTVHVGDLIIDGMPVIDYAAGGSAVDFLTTIDSLLTIDFDAVIPGHGRVMTKDDVRAYRVRFQTMNDRLQALIRSGVTKAQLATLDQARARLRLSDLGWDNSVSTTTWFGGISRYYDEMAGAR
jgi:cyclase